MRQIWYLTSILLFLGVLAGFSGLNSPTGLFVANLPPQWDYATDDFVIEGTTLQLDLNEAFYDPDKADLAFSVTPSKGVSAGVKDGVLTVFVEDEGTVTLSASDGHLLATQEITIRRIK